MLIKFLLHFNNLDKLFLIEDLYFSNLIFWQITVISKFMITELSRSILFLILFNNSIDEIFLYFFNGGKNFPISPLALAPSKASITEWSTTSPSECPIAL